MLIYAISENDHCRRLDSFLSNILPAAPDSYLQKLVRSGHVKVNGVLSSKGALLRISDTVTLKESSKTSALLAREKPGLDILYDDNLIIIFNKPAGLPVHRAAEVGDLNLVDLGTKFLEQRGTPGKLRPINRLDRGTSGAVIMAKSAVAAAMFGKMIMADGLGKLYLAVVSPKLPEHGIITAPLDGKESETRYRLLFESTVGSLAAVYPVTGRMHQIRQHLRYIGHPIWGDKRYAGLSLPGFTGHALHSFRTALTHPATGEELTICAPLSAEFLQLIRQLTGKAYSAVLQSLATLPEA
jgi:23S rRNA pseudouridine955/2504/2580 synthase